MQLNFEQNILFSGGADGSLAMIQIHDRAPDKMEMPEIHVQNDLVLVSRKTHSDQRYLVHQLKTEIAQKKDTHSRVLA